MKTLLYNFIRQEKCPPPATHIFEQKAEGGLLYGLASGVASKCTRIHTQMKRQEKKEQKKIYIIWFGWENIIFYILL